jgi:hypothetical protein
MYITNDFILRVSCTQHEQNKLAVVSACLSFFPCPKYLANLNAISH